MAVVHSHKMRYVFVARTFPAHTCHIKYIHEIYSPLNDFVVRILLLDSCHCRCSMGMRMGKLLLVRNTHRLLAHTHTHTVFFSLLLYFRVSRWCHEYTILIARTAKSWQTMRARSFAHSRCLPKNERGRRRKSKEKNTNEASISLSIVIIIIASASR